MLFTAHNFSLIFLFGRKGGNAVLNELCLSIIGQPKDKSAARSMRASFQQTAVKKNLQFEDLFKGIHTMNIELDSFLQKQILAYMKNNREDFLPMRAPTMIKVKNQIMLVLTKTQEKAKSTSLCFVRIIEDTTVMQYSMKPCSDILTRVEALSTIGEVTYEIPGAEVFLGVCNTEGHIYYLTNKHYCDPDADYCSPVEARFSSPPLVRKISISELEKLAPLMKQDAFEGPLNDQNLSPRSNMSVDNPWP